MRTGMAMLTEPAFSMVMTLDKIMAVTRALLRRGSVMIKWSVVTRGLLLLLLFLYVICRTARSRRSGRRRHAKKPDGRLLLLGMDLLHRLYVHHDVLDLRQVGFNFIVGQGGDVMPFFHGHGAVHFNGDVGVGGSAKDAGL